VIAQNGNRAQYSRSLLKYAAPAARIPFSPPGFGEQDVKTRVKNVLSYRKPAAVIVTLLLLLCLSVVLLFTLNRPLSADSGQETQPPQSEHTMQDTQGRDETSMPVSPSPSHPSRAVSDFMPQKAERLLFCDPLGKEKDHYLLAYADSDGNPLYYTAKANQTDTGFFYSSFTAALPDGVENAFGFRPLYVLNREESGTSELVILFQTLEGVRYQICTMTEITLPDGETADMWTSTVLLRTEFLSLYRPKETTVTALSEENWRFVLNFDGLFTSSAYQLLDDMVSGQSEIDDYNLFTIDRYAIGREGDYDLSFDFHVSESRHPSIGVGDYETILHDYVEPMLDGLHEFQSTDFNAFGEFSDREEVWMVAEWLLSRYHWRSPAFGEANERDISNYLCRYYGNGKLPIEEYKKLAKEKFGMENPSADGLPKVEQNGQLFVYSGDLGGLIRYEVKNVQTVGDSTEVTVRFYADYNRIVNSHLVTYVFGEGGVWREMRVEEESQYPPLGLMP